MTIDILSVETRKNVNKTFFKKKKNPKMRLGTVALTSNSSYSGDRTHCSRPVQARTL
jgi:hypothetical protein